MEGIERVRFTSPHPKDLRPETIEAMATEKAVCPHLHFPLQSGSDRVLGLMRRGYTAQRYLERLRAARAAVPDLAVTTDIIVGFPGEDEADFERTLEVAAEAEYDSAYTFIFSPVRARRRRRARRSSYRPKSWPSASSAYAWWWSAALCGATRRGWACTEEVLVEGPGQKGRSRCVFRADPAEQARAPGRRRPARRAWWSRRWSSTPPPISSKARFERVIAPPRHRQLIPVTAN